MSPVPPLRRIRMAHERIDLITAESLYPTLLIDALSTEQRFLGI
jgi:hypothetical protein